MFVLDYGRRKFFVKTIDEALTVVGEQYGEYTIEWVNDLNV